MRSALHSMKLVAALAAATSAAAQQPFDLDASFQTQLIQEYVSSALVVEDGKLLVSGRIVFQGNSTFTPNAGARLNADGSRDLLFQEYPATPGRLVRWNDKFYSGGQEVIRLNLDGTTDQSFIAMGLGPYFSSLQGGDYHVFPDGRVLMTGTHLLDDTARGFVGPYRLIWFSNEGYLDTTRVHRQANGVITLIKEELNGRFLCSGSMNSYEGSPVSVVFRIEADGSLDPGYSSPIQGIPTDIGSSFRNVVVLEPLADGRSLAGGFWRLAASTDTIGVMRLLPDGSQDPTFDPVPLSASGAFTNWIFPQCMDILPLPDGRMIITGNFDHVRGEPRGGIAMINADGSLSEDYFTGAGCGEYTSPEVNYRFIAGIVPAPNGEYYIHGAYMGYDDGTTNYPQQGFVSRLHGFNVGVREQELAPLQLHPNPTYGPLSITLPAGTNAMHAEVLDAHGRLTWSESLGASTEQVRLDLTELGEGAHMLRLRMHDGVVRNGRFVILK